MEREQVIPLLEKYVKVSVHVLGEVDPSFFYGRLVSVTEHGIELLPDNGSDYKEIQLEKIVDICIDKGCRGDKR